jgi:putative membrane protein
MAMKHLYLLSASVVLLAACNTAPSDNTAGNGDQTGMASENMSAQPAGDTATGDMAAIDAMGAEAPTDAAGYAAMAGASDMFEIESSKAAMAKSSNAELDKFAQMMVDNHTQSTAKVKAAAKTANLTLMPPKLNAVQQKMLDDIKNADGEDVVAIYWIHQKAAHNMALKLHQGYAANGDNADFKKVAGEVVPVVEKHIAELGKMKTS